MSRDLQSLIGCQTFSTESAEEPKLHAETHLKSLETENLRLRRAISDLTLEKLILKEAASGNF